MKYTLLLVSLLLISGPAQAQPRVRKDSPIYKVDYRMESNYVITRILLRSAISGQDYCDATSFDVSDFTVTTPGGSTFPVDIETFGSQPTPDSFMTRTFKIGIGNAPRSLSPDWTSFTFSFKYKCTSNPDNPQIPGPELAVYRALIDKGEQYISTFDPIWLDEGPLVPVCAKGDTVVDVALKDSAGQPVAEKREYVEKCAQLTDASQASPVQLNLLPGQSINPQGTYQVEANVIQGGLPLYSNNPRQWIAQNKVPKYAILPESTPPLTATSNEPFSITVKTTEPGSLRLRFEDPELQSVPIPVVSDGLTHTFTVPISRDWVDGRYPFHFEGRSKNGPKDIDEQRKYVLLKETVPHLTGSAGVQLSEDNQLQIDFALSRKISNGIRGIGAYQNLRVDSELAAGQNAGPPFRYHLKIDLNDSTYLKPFRDAVENNAGKGLVKLQIVAADEASTPIFALEIPAVRLSKEEVLAKLNEADLALHPNEGGTKDEALAAAKVREALGLKPNPPAGDPENEAVDYIVKRLRDDDTTKRSKLKGVLKFAAKLTASYFGIPIFN